METNWTLFGPIQYYEGSVFASSWTLYIENAASSANSSTSSASHKTAGEVTQNCRIVEHSLWEGGIINANYLEHSTVINIKSQRIANSPPITSEDLAYTRRFNRGRGGK